MVVFQITYDDCQQKYIGKTKRILNHRLDEHKSPNKDSAIQIHRKEFSIHNIEPYNIEIIDRADKTLKPS